MSLVSALQKARETVPKPFVAPIPEAAQVSLFSLQDGIPFRFIIRAGKPGWWVIEPVSRRNARIKEPAHILDCVDYLSQLPRFTAIYLFSTGSQSGMVVPYNDGDANQRGWSNGEPRIMHLTRSANLIPLTVIQARDLAGTLLYDSQAIGHPASSWLSAKFMQWVNNHETLWGEDDFPGNFRNAFLLAYAEATERMRRHIFEDAESSIKHKLGAYGADLVSWSPRDKDNGFNVTWSFGGEIHSMTVTKELRIKSAGICLAGGDRDQDLASIVPVMQMRSERW